VVPVYNNAASLDELVKRLKAVLDARKAPYEIVLVDDGSADESWKIITTNARADDRVVGIHLSRNFGQQPATRAGLHRATGDITVLMDADLQDRPEEIPAMLEALTDDVDIVVTTWNPDKTEVRERLSSRIFHRIFSAMVGVQLPRNLGTYRLFTREFRDAVLDYPESTAVYGPLMAQMGFNPSYVEVIRSAPTGRKSSYSFRKRARLAMNTLLTYSDVPYRAVSWSGVALVAASLGYLLLVVGQYLVYGRRVPAGITLVLIVQLLLFGAVLACLGVLGAYLFRIFREVLQRPHYHVAREAGKGLRPEPADGD
jgi:glycosyltransferase involved in cell wall biosynthesis